MLIQNNISEIQIVKDTSCSENIEGFLKNLLISLSNNRKGAHTRNSYEDAFKKNCTYLFIISGPLAYETLYSNLKNALPSISTVRREIKSDTNTILEGQFRFKELK